MIVYEANKKQFLHHSDFDDIEDLILAKYRIATGKRVNESEVRSWRESLNHVARVLRDDEIPDAMRVAIE